MPTPTSKRFREEKNTLEGQIVRFAKSGKLAKAGRRAVRAQKKHGLPTTFKQGSKIVRVHPDGRVETLANIQPTPYQLPPGVDFMRSKQ